MHHQNMLAAERSAWALTQADVAQLLGFSADTIGNYELCERMPSVVTAVGMMLIFGKTFAQLCPDLARQVAGEILPRAQAFSLDVEQRPTAIRQRNQQFLSALADRLSVILPDA